MSVPVLAGRILSQSAVVCGEAKPKINTAAALWLWLPAPPLTGTAIPPPPKHRKGKEIFLAWQSQDKYFVFTGFPT